MTSFWRLLGRYWVDFPSKPIVEDVWRVFRPYLDSVMGEFESKRNTLGLDPNVYYVSRRYVHERVDVDNLNSVLSVKHEHYRHYVTYSGSGAITVSDDVLSIEGIYVNGVCLPTDRSLYHITYGSGSFSVTPVGGWGEAGDRIMIAYCKEGSGLHKHVILSSVSGAGQTGFTFDCDGVYEVYVNGTLYPDTSWSFSAGTVTLSDALAAGDTVSVAGYETAFEVNHFHESVCSDYASLTVRIPTAFTAAIKPYINGILTQHNAGTYGTPPAEFYLAFSEPFTGFYFGSLAVDGKYSHRSKLESSNVIRLVNASNTVYDNADRKFLLESTYTIRDGESAWIYHNEEITQDLYCDEAWYDESTAYLLFGTRIGLGSNVITSKYVRTLKSLIAYMLGAKTEDKIKRLYSCLFNVPLNVIADDKVYDIRTNENGETVIEMGSGAEYNIRFSNPIVSVNDTLSLMQPLCDAVEVGGFHAVQHTAGDDAHPFSIPRDPASSPGALRRMPTALYQANDVDVYSNIYGWYFGGPWSFDS